MGVKVFSAAEKETTARPPEMSLHDAYVGSLEAKKEMGEQKLRELISIYDAHKAGNRAPELATPANLRAATHQANALIHFVQAIDANIASAQVDRTLDVSGFEMAVRRAYRSMIEDFGVERVDPAASGGVAKYDEWFKLYNKSFPIRGERETKSDMCELLEEPMTDKGYGERALGLRDPLSGKYMGGVQFLAVAEAKAGMFTYAFLDPSVQGFGLGRTLVETTRKAVADISALYNPQDDRAPVVFLEKNKPELMTVENMVLDTSGINVNKLPRAGTNLAHGAVSQSERDARWSALGAKEIVNAGYIQPSLGGVTAAADEDARILAIRYLQNDVTLSDKQKDAAAKIIKVALGGKAEHCPLALCAFVGDDQASIPALQTQQFLSAFYRTSCLDTDETGLAADIFAQATLTKLGQQADANGNLALKAIAPYAGPIAVQSFAQAEQVFQSLLRVAPIGDIRAAANAARAGKAEKSCGVWLAEYEDKIRADLGLNPAAPAARTRQAAKPGF